MTGREPREEGDLWFDAVNTHMHGSNLEILVLFFWILFTADELINIIFFPSFSLSLVMNDTQINGIAISVPTGQGGKEGRMEVSDRFCHVLNFTFGRIMDYPTPLFYLSIYLLTYLPTYLHRVKQAFFFHTHTHTHTHKYGF